MCRFLGAFSLGDSVNGLAHVLHVAGREAGHTDSSILGQVDTVLLHQPLTLILVQAGEAEHANLIGDVLPRSATPLRLEHIAQLSSHGDDSLGHLAHVLQPLSSQSGIVQYFRGNASTVNGWVRVEGANDDLDLRHDLGRLVLISTGQGEGTHTLAVEAHVLGERLGQGHLMAFVDEQSQSAGIAINVARGETLVGHVEEGEQLALLDHVAQLFPLVQLRKEGKQNVKTDR